MEAPVAGETSPAEALATGGATRAEWAAARMPAQGVMAERPRRPEARAVRLVPLVRRAREAPEEHRIP